MDLDQIDTVPGQYLAVYVQDETGRTYSTLTMPK